MFYIEKNENNMFVFHLKSDHNHTIATSKPYKKVSLIETEIDYINQNTNLDRIYERKTNNEGKFYFKILDIKLNTTAKSQFYSSKAGLENGIKAAKKYAKIKDIKTFF